MISDLLLIIAVLTSPLESHRILPDDQIGIGMSRIVVERKLNESISSFFHNPNADTLEVNYHRAGVAVRYDFSWKVVSIRSISSEVNSIKKSINPRR
jgi:hypothetical protein